MLRFGSRSLQVLKPVNSLSYTSFARHYTVEHSQKPSGTSKPGNTTPEIHNPPVSNNTASEEPIVIEKVHSEPPHVQTPRNPKNKTATGVFLVIGSLLVLVPVSFELKRALNQYAESQKHMPHQHQKGPQDTTSDKAEHYDKAAKLYQTILENAVSGETDKEAKQNLFKNNFMKGVPEEQQQAVADETPSYITNPENTSETTTGDKTDTTPDMVDQQSFTDKVENIVTTQYTAPETTTATTAEETIAETVESGSTSPQITANASLEDKELTPEQMQQLTKLIQDEYHLASLAVIEQVAQEYELSLAQAVELKEKEITEKLNLEFDQILHEKLVEQQGRYQTQLNNLADEIRKQSFAQAYSRRVKRLQRLEIAKENAYMFQHKITTLLPFLDQSHHVALTSIATDKVVKNLTKAQPFAESIRKLQAELGQVKDDGTDEVISTVLESLPTDLSRTGIPTVSQLHNDFKVLSEEALRLAYTPKEAGMFGFMVGKLLSKISVRQVGFVEGETPEARITRARAYLYKALQNDVADRFSDDELRHEALFQAAREIEQISNAEIQALTREWQKLAKARIAAEQAMQVIQACLVTKTKSLA